MCWQCPANSQSTYNVVLEEKITYAKKRNKCKCVTRTGTDKKKTSSSSSKYKCVDDPDPISAPCYRMSDGRPVADYPPGGPSRPDLLFSNSPPAYSCWDCPSNSGKLSWTEEPRKCKCVDMKCVDADPLCPKVTRKDDGWYGWKGTLGFTKEVAGQNCWKCPANSSWGSTFYAPAPENCMCAGEGLCVDCPPGKFTNPPTGCPWLKPKVPAGGQ